MTGLVAAVVVTALVLTAVIPFGETLAGLRTALLGGAGLFISLALLGVLWRSGNIRLLTLPLVGLAISIIFLGTGLRSVNPAVQLQSQLLQMPEGTEYGFHGFKEPSMVFYTDSRWEPLDTHQLNAFLSKPGPRVLVIEDSEIRLEDALESFLPAENGEGRRPMNVRDFSKELNGVNTDGYEETDFEGINIARTCFVKVRVFSRK